MRDAQDKGRDAEELVRAVRAQRLSDVIPKIVTGCYGSAHCLLEHTDSIPVANCFEYFVRLLDEVERGIDGGGSCQAFWTTLAGALGMLSILMLRQKVSKKA